MNSYPTTTLFGATHYWGGMLLSGVTRIILPMWLRPPLARVALGYYEMNCDWHKRKETASGMNPNRTVYARLKKAAFREDYASALFQQRYVHDSYAVRTRRVLTLPVGFLGFVAIWSGYAQGLSLQNFLAYRGINPAPVMDKFHHFVNGILGLMH